VYWVLQKDLEAGHALEAMVDLLVEEGLPHIVVDVVPFSHELIPEPDVGSHDQVVIYGALSLKDVAVSRGWLPGAYLNEDFVFEKWLEHWGNHLLNSDASVCRFGDIDNKRGDFFVRPCATDKTFTGVKVSWEEYVRWRAEVASGDTAHCYRDLTLDTPVSYAPLKYIESECRFFIVDGRISTASFYRIQSEQRLRPVEFFNTPWYDFEMEKFVLARIADWQPDNAFVLDVARVDESSCKIVEVNCLNSSGLYECDPRRIVLDVEEMERVRRGRKLLSELEPSSPCHICGIARNIPGGPFCSAPHGMFAAEKTDD